jgi:putative transposase
MARLNDSEYFRRMLLTCLTETDPLLKMLQWVAERLAEMEAEQKVGAEKGKHTTDRKTHFSGTRVRRFDTRLGSMYLLIPKLRHGGFIPFFVTEKKRSEAAMIDVVHEAFINGVSTRKIEKLAQALGVENISASQVSEINKGLDDQVEAFRNQPLAAEYPILWVDALYEKIRDNGKVISEAILVIYGVNLEGKREILDVQPMYDESEASWTSVFDRLKTRGLQKVWLVVSDAHRGIQNASRHCFLGSCWQRCKVHLMRNILARVNHKEKKIFSEKMKQIWLQPDRKSAVRTARIFMAEYKQKYPEAVAVLSDGLEDSLQFYAFPDLDSRKISSTNVLERLNKEIRRRSRVVGVFPSEESYIRLLCCYLIEYTEDWEHEKSYIRKEALDQLKTHREEVA